MEATNNKNIYIASVACYDINHGELFTFPLGLFNTEEQAKEKCDESVEELKEEFLEDCDDNDDYVDDNYIFDYTIKLIE